jgi:hypothetical protein
MILIIKDLKEQPIAYFVERPSRTDDLVPPPPWAEPHPFKVTVTIELSRIDYENFTTDLKADRPFLYEHMNDSYIANEVWHCILVRQKGRSDGLLVRTSGRDYPTWAAYLYEVVSSD